METAGLLRRGEEVAQPGRSLLQQREMVDRQAGAGNPFVFCLKYGETEQSYGEIREFECRPHCSTKRTGPPDLFSPSARTREDR